MIFIIYFYTCCRLLWVQGKTLVEDSGGLLFRELFILFFFCYIYIYIVVDSDIGELNFWIIHMFMIVFLDYIHVHWTHMFMTVFFIIYMYIELTCSWLLFLLYTCTLNLHVHYCFLDYIHTYIDLRYCFLDYIHIYVNVRNVKNEYGKC